MDELGAAFCRVTELSGRKRMNATAASVSRFQDGYSLARASEFARGHQACGACADDDDVVWIRWGHLAAIEPLRRHPHSGSGSAEASHHLPAPGCSPASSP